MHGLHRFGEGERRLHDEEREATQTGDGERQDSDVRVFTSFI